PGWRGGAPAPSAWTTRLHGWPMPGGSSANSVWSFPYCRRTPRRCLLRRRDQRVRRQHLVRPVPLDPRGLPAAQARRGSRLPGQRLAERGGLEGPQTDGPGGRRAMRTILCDLLGIRFPIIQDGMGPFSTAALAAAVSEAGGLGTVSIPGML